jgi:Ni,Fe-hydrogenase III small subunit
MTTETDVIVGIHFLYSETGRRAIQPTPDERIGFVVSVDGDEVTRGAIGDLKGGFDEACVTAKELAQARANALNMSVPIKVRIDGKPPEGADRETLNGWV